ncbi:hypothetical protein C0993_005138, partial [Termitomyces sp. T159_Od127]
VFGLITKEGDIDTNLWDMMKNALLRPHCDAVRFQARADSCRQEKERKKRRLEESGIAGPSRPHGAKHAPKKDAPTDAPLSDCDADGEVEDHEMLEEYNSS